MLLCAGVAQGQLVYDKMSEIVLWETITDLGGGQWLYEYEVSTNNESEGIWLIGVFSTFGAQSSSWTPFNAMFAIAALASSRRRRS